MAVAVAAVVVAAVATAGDRQFEAFASKTAALRGGFLMAARPPLSQPPLSQRFARASRARSLGIRSRRAQPSCSSSRMKR